MEFESYLRFVATLVFVIALIGLLAFLMRRYSVGGRMMRNARGRRRLSIVEVSPIDGKRRLVLIRRDDKEHLLVVGATGELVVESGIPAPDGAAEPAEDGDPRAVPSIRAGAGEMS